MMPVAIYKNGALEVEKRGNIFFEEKTVWLPSNPDKLIEGEKYIFRVENNIARVLTRCRKK